MYLYIVTFLFVLVLFFLFELSKRVSKANFYVLCFCAFHCCQNAEFYKQLPPRHPNSFQTLLNRGELNLIRKCVLRSLYLAS